MSFHYGQKVTFGPWVSALGLLGNQPWQGGRACFCGTGAMAGASTGSLQFSMDGGATYFTVYDINGVIAQLTAAGLRNFTCDLPPGQYQCLLSANPTGFTGYLIGV